MVQQVVLELDVNEDRLVPDEDYVYGDDVWIIWDGVEA